MAELPYLFVYGTLRAGADTKWSGFLAGSSRFVGTGRVRGELFQLGSYPGMTLSTSEVWVKGEVCLLDDPPAALRSLDAYEGCSPGDPLPHEFERRVVSVVLESGGTVEAWAYIYALGTQGKARIASGQRRTASWSSG